MTENNNLRFEYKQHLDVILRNSKAAYEILAIMIGFSGALLGLMLDKPLFSYAVGFGVIIVTLSTALIIERRFETANQIRIARLKAIEKELKILGYNLIDTLSGKISLISKKPEEYYFDELAELIPVESEKTFWGSYVCHSSVHEVMIWATNLIVILASLLLSVKLVSFLV